MELLPLGSTVVKWTIVQSKLPELWSVSFHDALIFYCSILNSNGLLPTVSWLISSTEANQAFWQSLSHSNHGVRLCFFYTFCPTSRCLQLTRSEGAALAGGEAPRTCSTHDRLITCRISPDPPLYLGVKPVNGQTCGRKCCVNWMN